MLRVRQGEPLVPWSSRERARLHLITRDPMLKKRYATASQGVELMGKVCYERREQLLSLAKDLTGTVVREWNKISQDKNIAVVLFGSVARGLVRNPSHADPSNIDMSIMGSITGEERAMLMDAIRPARLQVRSVILAAYGGEENFPPSTGNAGIFVQDVDKLINNKYACAKEYISSNATVLYDPAGIWTAIEAAALDHEFNLRFGKDSQQSRGRQLAVPSRDVYSSV
jgi:predicted nucleotidyltransferase